MIVVIDLRMSGGDDRSEVIHLVMTDFDDIVAAGTVNHFNFFECE